MPIGFSFQPGSMTEVRPRGAQGFRPSPQEAIRLLSMRLPKRQAPGQIAPGALLGASGAAGVPAGGMGGLDQVLAALMRVAPQRPFGDFLTGERGLPGGTRPPFPGPIGLPGGAPLGDPGPTPIPVQTGMPVPPPRIIPGRGVEDDAVSVSSQAPPGGGSREQMPTGGVQPLPIDMEDLFGGGRRGPRFPVGRGPFRPSTF